MNKPTLYISGAISNMPDLNRTKFANATKQLRALGYIVVNPHEICEGLTADQWQECMRRCIAKMMDCDMLIMLDDWQQSKGAQIEFSLAQELRFTSMSFLDFLKIDHNYDN